MNFKNEHLEIIKNIIDWAFSVNSQKQIAADIDINGFPLSVLLTVYEVNIHSENHPVIFKENFSGTEAQITKGLNVMLDFLKECVMNNKIDYEKLKPIKRTIPAQPEEIKIIGYYL